MVPIGGRWIRARAAVGGPGLTIRVATVVTLMLSAIAILGGPAALLFDNLQELVAVTGAAAGLGLASRTANGSMTSRGLHRRGQGTLTLAPGNRPRTPR